MVNMFKDNPMEVPILNGQTKNKLLRLTLPAIGFDIIRGINVGDHRFSPDASKFTVAYLYGKLDSDHGKELADILETHGFAVKSESKTTAPTKPSSSTIIANMESPTGSGR